MQSCHLKAFTIWPKALIANNKSSKQEWEERFKMPRLQSSSFALLPPIIIHFHDMQSLWEKSFVSFQHFPPHFSSSTRTCPRVGSCPLIISFCSTSNVLDQHFLFDVTFLVVFIIRTSSLGGVKFWGGSSHWAGKGAGADLESLGQKNMNWVLSDG